MHSTKNENLISPASPSALKSYFLASRPKTWSASLCPVLIGAALAAKGGELAFGTLFLTALFSLFIQIGTNFANDYFDFKKGADTSARIGPKRAVQQGWISPEAMRIATAIAFFLAFCFALPLMLRTGLWSFGLAALCILFGVIYTGGPKPLGYAGLGEVLVFLFFGPVACMGTYYLQTGAVNSSILIASLAPGALSSAILLANNLRDVATDRIAGKKTLVVRFGSPFGKSFYTFMIIVAFLVPITLGLSTKLIAACTIVFLPLPKLWRSQDVFQESCFMLLAYTLLFCILIW